MDKTQKHFNAILSAGNPPANVDRERRVLRDVVITSNTRDRQGDIVESKGLDWANFQKNPVVIWNHDTGCSNSPNNNPVIGKVLSVTPGERETRADIEFADTPFAMEIFDLYTKGYMRAWSIGFIPKRFEKIKGQGKSESFHVFEAEVYELSAVPVGCNPEAVTKALKVGGYDKPEIVRTGDDLYGIVDGRRLAQGALSKTVRERGLPLPEGCALILEPVEEVTVNTDGIDITEIRQARIKAIRMEKSGRVLSAASRTVLTQIKERIDRAWEEVDSAFDELEAILGTTDRAPEDEAPESITEERLFAGQKRMGVTVNKSHVSATDAAITAAESSAAAALALYDVG